MRPSYSDDVQLLLDNVIRIHKDLLQLIRTTQSNQSIYVLIVEYCIKNADNFNEYSKRVTLWLISLYKPTLEQIQLAECLVFAQINFKNHCIKINL